MYDTTVAGSRAGRDIIGGLDQTEFLQVILSSFLYIPTKSSLFERNLPTFITSKKAKPAPVG